MKTQNYKVTETAGNFVAGIRNPGAGQTIELTPEQAFYPLIASEIEEVAAPPADADQPSRRRPNA